MKMYRKGKVMTNLTIRPVEQKHAKFIWALMNNELIMLRLNEVPTALEIWENAIINWKDDYFKKKKMEV